MPVIKFSLNLLSLNCLPLWDLHLHMRSSSFIELSSTVELWAQNFTNYLLYLVIRAQISLKRVQNSLVSLLLARGFKPPFLYEILVGNMLLFLLTVSFSEERSCLSSEPRDLVWGISKNFWRLLLVSVERKFWPSIGIWKECRRRLSVAERRKTLN